jgi:Glycosyl transferase family 2
MNDASGYLPPVTIIIEWENAIDVEDEWAKRAMSSFQDELARCHNIMTSKPQVMYLYDQGAVDATVIHDTIAQAAPRLRELADVQLVPTQGLTYYQLKNYGVQKTTTELVIFLDSDAGPQPGWLEGLVKPFAKDHELVAVGGFTVLGYEDLLSKTMALSWIFNLPSEREITVKRKKIHANNAAFRTAFFKANPFPDLEGPFKKACGFWLRDIDKRGFKWMRTADAMTVHAPHPGGKFIIWRAWTTGMDRDFQAYHTVTKSRVGRIGYSFVFFGKKLARSWFRIWAKGGEVDLPLWQRPAAMILSLGFFSGALVGELQSAVTRSFAPLPVPGPHAKPAVV